MKEMEDRGREGSSSSLEDDFLDSDMMSSFVGVTQTLTNDHALKEKRRQPKGTKEPESVEAKYEKSARKSSAHWSKDDTHRSRLPVKDVEGRVLLNTNFFAVENNRERPSQVEQETGIEASEAAAERDLHEMQSAPQTASVLETLAPHERRAYLKDRIAELCTSIIESPEKSLRRGGNAQDDSQTQVGKSSESLLSELHSIAQDSFDPAIQRLATLSEFAVFKDILPDYRIRALSQAEKSAKVSKDVKARRNYESGLLFGYQNFLKHLENLSAPPQMTATRLVAVRCVSNLLLEKPHFNFSSSTLVPIVAKRGSDRNEQIRNECCKGVMQIFRQDRDHETIVGLVKAIAKQTHGKNSQAHEDLVRTLFHLPLKVHQDELPEARKAVKRKRKHKKQKDIDAELQEAQAAADEDLYKTFQVDIMHETVLVYFRILKGGKATVHLLPIALEGLARIVHLINLDTAEDMLDVICVSLENYSMSPEAVLHSILLVLTALAGPGKEIQRDDAKFLRHFFRVLLEIPGSPGSASCIPLVCRCLELAFIQRREYSIERVAAFIKRVCMICTQLEGSAAFDLLSSVHTLAVRYPSARQLFDDEEDRIAGGIFDPACDDPDACNALSTSCWELAVVAKSPHGPTRKAVELLVELGKVDDPTALGNAAANLRRLNGQKNALGSSLAASEPAHKKQIDRGTYDRRGKVRNVGSSSRNSHRKGNHHKRK